MCKRTLKAARSIGTALALWLSAGLPGPSGLAQAAVIDISAAFKASSGGSAFSNTTPASGFCLEYGGCGSEIASVAVPISYDRAVLTGLPAVGRRWSLQTPPQSTVTLVSETGATLDATFKVTHVAQVLGGQGFDRRENPGSHSSAGGNCSFTAPYGSDGDNQVGFIWRVADPVSGGLCYPATSGTSTEREILATARSLSVGYKLVLPASHNVRGGRYSGSVTYSVGEVGDFSLGSQVSNLSDSSITFNFTVDVQHQLSVTFAPGSDNVTLQPPIGYGGWHEYLTGQKPAPQTLWKYIAFRISASGPFDVYLRCSEMAPSYHCRIRDTKEGRLTVRYVVILSLPPGFVRAEDGIPIRQYGLYHDTRTRILPPGNVTEGEGLLRVGLISPEFRSNMLTHPGVPFRGNFTMVFDAQI